MKTKSKICLITIPFACILLFFTSCHSDKKDMTVLPTTPLYDTLGWFIQGATGQVSGQGTKMIDDPDNEGQQIQAGRLAIRTVVNKALGVIASDNRLAVYFPTLLAEVGNGNTTGLAHLLNSFTDFVQTAVSKQDVYTGPDMKTVHNHATFARFGSTEHPTSDKKDFDIFVGDVAQAATELNVPVSVINQLGALLYTTEGDIASDAD
ncbi:hypothetical protein SAMN05192529_11428 [Arachidicoccus rhizosphaerae]|uniref:Group 1 truncated hemoglobin n=1 Tax=Arachidicoccus rhizosphaerae TaxID=551991 RepID=A0A1H4ACI6_9BACT|nr:hypothetical protein [Arachidicoccus rhizosphaerae]SEA33478.1 hypothetical protein SAMN05192529_11428 [Arachidicoccus rhizosphaerae]